MHACRDSCFGQSTNLMGITNFMCQELPGRLIECNHEDIADSCTAEAGVICGKVTDNTNTLYHSPHADSLSCLRTIIADTPEPQTCDYSDTTSPTSTSSLTTSSTPPSLVSTSPANTTLPDGFNSQTTHFPTNGASGEGQQSRTDSCTAIGGGLGALAAVLALTLVGVILGWVWHCRRNNRKSSQR